MQPKHIPACSWLLVDYNKCISMLQCCRYKFWLTNGDPWDFFHYHFSADEFYILPILMVRIWEIRSQWPILEIGLRGLHLDPPYSHFQKCNPGTTLDLLMFFKSYTFLYSYAADNFYTPPSRSSGPQSFFRCRFYFQCFGHLTFPNCETFNLDVPCCCI